jgi:hypothetical protein
VTPDPAQKVVDHIGITVADYERSNHPDYCGGYVLDPDGNNIEAVCHQPE